MAFNLVPSQAGQELGPELGDLYTDEIGFKGLSADANIRLLPTPWPEDAVPSPTSSLLAVAQSKGLVVGAGPDALVVASADSVRKAIEAPSGEEKVKTKPFQPQATIPLPSRPTHVAFTANDDALILATENGSQISVFQTSALLSGNFQPAKSIQTSGASIRALVPNPDPSSTFVALVTVNGELLVADLKAGNLVQGANGPVLKNGVSSVAWSNKGKQLVAGLADGSAEQMTPDGTKKDSVPRPSDLEGDCHVSSISWLENDVFFMVYTPNAVEDDMGQNPASFYYIITRRKQAPFLVQKLPEICSTMGFQLKRSPAYNFIVRLRDYKPGLKDVLIVSSTASTDVGLITRPEQPLGDDEASKSVVGRYTTTEVNDDAKRASVPLKDSVDETSVIGLAADLSATANVETPIKGEDIPNSSTPLPGLFLLNNDGILSSWWFIYSDAVRQKVAYPGLVSASQTSMNTSQMGASTPAPAQPSIQTSSPAQQKPAFGQSGFGAPSAFGTPSALGSSTLGKPSGGATFGSPSALGASTMGATAFGKQSAPSFGSPSQIGGGGASSFGQPSFGTPSQPGVGFGSTSTPGQAKFGQSGFGAASGFGQSTTPGKSLLGTGSASSGGGFGAFSSGGGGFGGLAASKTGESPFGKPQGQSAFGAPQASSPFGAPAKSDTAFPPPSAQPKNPFGGGGNAFSLGSSFKPANPDVSDEPKSEKQTSGAFSFGNSFETMVESSNKASPQPESMDDGEDSAVPPPVQPPKTEPTSLFGKPAPQTNSLFGQPTPSTTPTSLFGKPTTQPTLAKSPTPIETKSGFSFGSTTTQPSSQFGNQTQITSPLSVLSDKTAAPKREQSVSTPKISSFDQPLPPDSTSRDSYAPGDTSASSNVSKSSVEDAPLPPDFVAPKKSSIKAEDAPLPPDFLGQKKPLKSDPSPPTNLFGQIKSSTKAEEAPLPPDFTKKSAKPEDAPLPPDFVAPAKSAVKTEDAPLPPDFLGQKKAIKNDAPFPANPFGQIKSSKAEEAPLPPDFITKPKSSKIEKIITKPISSSSTMFKSRPASRAPAVPVPDDSDADSNEDYEDSEQDERESADEYPEEGEDESDFSDSGEEITHDETKIPSPKPSVQSSFGGMSDKSSTGGLFSGFSKTSQKQGKAPSKLFGEIPKQPLLPPPGPIAREPYRSPSPTRLNSQKSSLFESRPAQPAGSALHARKASLTQIAQQRGSNLRKASDAAREEQARAHQAAQQRQEEEEALSLSDDDEDERLRADLSRPIEPVSTLDPFLPHQNYMGETAKPGVAGMIERLYRDINSMIDTLGINARSLESYLLYQQSSNSADDNKLVKVLKSDQPANALDEKLLLRDIGKFDDVVTSLATSLNEQRVQGVEEKLDQCRELLTKDIVTLRGQCASIRKSLDAYTDTGAIFAAPLSAEHAALQHDLRSFFTDIQSKMADLEQGVSMLRAKIADIPRADGDSRHASKRPTVEAVAKTISTMMSMAENKSSDIDVLEAQMRRLGVDIANTVPNSREGSPFTTPRKNTARFPTTPGSRGSVDNTNSAYHTPESASRGVNFRASINGSTKHSRLRSVESIAPVVAQEESALWKAKTQRRQHLIANLKKAIDKKEDKVRGINDL
ncbi:Nuclear pore complex protein [Penicillium malachiteum]|nr:Nuclear pore complex protein [Penicillium malachiteum]